MPEYLLSPEAVEDLQNIWDYVAVENPQAADDLINNLFLVFERLAQWPGQGHTRPDLTSSHVLFWPFGSYLIVYRGQPVVQIIAILHGARDIPAVLSTR